MNDCPFSYSLETQLGYTVWVLHITSTVPEGHVENTGSGGGSQCPLLQLCKVGVPSLSLGLTWHLPRGCLGVFK